MIPDIEEAKYLADYRLWVKFHDGTQGELDLEKELWGEVFEPLRDVNFFRQLKLDPELRTIVWPNGADFSPEFLYSECRSAKMS